MKRFVLFPCINETPFKVGVIGGVTRRLVTPLNLYDTKYVYVYHHTCATIKVCKLFRKLREER